MLSPRVYNRPMATRKTNKPKPRKRKKPAELCGARTKDGTPCRRPKGWGTETPGQGPCRDHPHHIDIHSLGHESGELTEDNFDHLTNEDFRRLTLLHKRSKHDPFSLVRDIAQARAMRDHLNNTAEITRNNLAAWSRDTKRKPPKSLIDLGGYEIAARIDGNILKMVEVELKRQNMESLTLADIEAIFPKIADTAATILRDVLTESLPDLPPQTVDEILVTHSKRTMNRADVMYGVTMEEFGVSKPVGMRLTEAEGAKKHAKTETLNLDG